MDYEFQILRHEKELAHLREMQNLLGKHQDTTDLRLDKIQENLRETTATMVVFATQLQTLGVHVQTIAGNVDALIKALLREHPNGRGEP